MGRHEVGDYAEVESRDDGTAVLKHIPSGNTVEVDADGVHAESLHAGSLNNAPATMTWGDQGEFMLLTTQVYLPGETPSTSSTDWVEAGGIYDRIISPFAITDQMTNTENLYVSVSARIDSGQRQFDSEDIPRPKLVVDLRLTTIVTL